MKLLTSLLSGMKACCAAVPDPRKGRGGNIAMADFGLSAFAMFFMRDARLFCPFSARWRKARAARTAKLCSESKKSPPTITSATCWTRRIRRCWRPCFTRLEQLFAAPPILSCTDSAASLWKIGRKNPDRLGRDGIFLLAKTRLPALSDPQTRQRQGRELSHHAGGNRGRARPFQGYPAIFGVYLAARRRRKARLRAQCGQALVSPTCRACSPVAPHLSWR